MPTTRLIALCLSVLLLTEGATAAGGYAPMAPAPRVDHSSIYRQSAFQPRLLTPLLSYAEALSANLRWIIAGYVLGTGGIGSAGIQARKKKSKKTRLSPDQKLRRDDPVPSKFLEKLISAEKARWLQRLAKMDHFTAEAVIRAIHTLNPDKNPTWIHLIKAINLQKEMKGGGLGLAAKLFARQKLIIETSYDPRHPDLEDELPVYIEPSRSTPGTVTRALIKRANDALKHSQNPITPDPQESPVDEFLGKLRKLLAKGDPVTFRHLSYPGVIVTLEEITNTGKLRLQIPEKGSTLFSTEHVMPFLTIVKSLMIVALLLGAISSPGYSAILAAGVGPLFFFRPPLQAAFESVAGGRAFSAEPLHFSEAERSEHIRRYRELISSYPPDTPLYQRLFQFFVSRYSGTLTEQDVEDVLQETWFRAWQNANTFHGLASPETFFSTIAERLALLAIRQRSRQGGSTSLSLSDPEDPKLFNLLILPDNQAVITFLKQVLKMMGKMNPNQSIVLILISLGMEYHEIANVLGVPLGTIQSRLSRARANLIERLNRSPSPMKAAA